ncbi:hypothetical protein Nocox_19295 [Nonomuraea coxensis DSM 45129]|uniref:Secreted protein n=1 Tax=Nonomuraea coxensis DSM 45129 TaxID=1122611 RepID=A0ABX8U1N2_9ACTN|nr:hypothetical protein [Nonomuraea coxensis]QYC41468.1 hypothetical protein Nocox_19295 [Nonomuraea coxensis DSM 45129]
MTATRALAALAVTATAAAVLMTPAAAQAAAGPATTAAAAQSAPIVWGPAYAPGRRAKAAGKLIATGEDHADLPTAAVVTISGTVQDSTRSASCGWAVFRITYRKGNNLPNRNHWVRDCSYRTPKHFTLKHHDVYQVELKVCAEAKAAKPSLNCLYAGTWKTLYLSK